MFTDAGIVVKKLSNIRFQWNNELKYIFLHIPTC